MTNEEVKQAMLKRLPVEYRNIRYTYISEFTLHFGPDGKPVFTVGLMDRNLNSITRADPKQVRLAK